MFQKIGFSLLVVLAVILLLGVTVFAYPQPMKCLSPPNTSHTPDFCLVNNSSSYTINIPAHALWPATNDASYVNQINQNAAGLTVQNAPFGKMRDIIGTNTAEGSIGLWDGYYIGDSRDCSILNEGISNQTSATSYKPNWCVNQQIYSDYNEMTGLASYFTGIFDIFGKPMNNDFGTFGGFYIGNVGEGGNALFVHPTTTDIGDPIFAKIKINGKSIYPGEGG